MPQEYDDGYIDRNAFEAADADTEDTLRDPDELWEEVLRFYGLDESATYCDSHKQGYIDLYQKRNSWLACQAIADLPGVDEAIRAFLDDPHNDSAVLMVRAIRNV